MGRLLNLSEAQKLPPGQLKDWAYNSLDVTGTREVADTLLPKLTPTTERTYQFERALQQPAFSMMMKGVRVDLVKRAEMTTELRRELAKDNALIAKMPGISDVWDGVELETGWCPAELGKHHKWPRGVADTPEKKC